VWGLLVFFRARTAIIPNQPARRLVTSGPYRFSRNPMYVGLSALYVGLALPCLMWHGRLCCSLSLSLRSSVSSSDERSDISLAHLVMHTPCTGNACDVGCEPRNDFAAPSRCGGRWRGDS
jgi:protein-S-isoprenylcysteine O-methyltransferase Ste14